jgi:diadenosine tetraphosphatase ApaH/serine/threonine PP2A family protein phosphatase
MTLHVTNGDIIAERLRLIGVEGSILPWREVLHEGDLGDYASADPAGLHQFNHNRAAFIESRGWGRAEHVLEEMDRRDHVLLDPHWKEIVLWVEQDLFDQLILAQVLTLLHRTSRFARVDVRLVQTTRHLNYLTDSELIHAGRTPRTLTTETIAPYVSFWTDVANGLPFDITTNEPDALKVARRQWLELQPDEEGLSTFDRRVLEIVQRRGSMQVDVLFQQINAEEGDAAFWGDTSFMARIFELATKVKALRVADDRLEYAG